MVDGDLRVNLDRFNPKVKEGIGTRFRYQTPRAETFMKHNAPWNDRTTNARNGLFTNYDHAARGNVFTMILAGSVDYQIFLEQGTEDMYARPIIVPTMFIFAEKIQASLSKLIDRLR